MPVNIFPQKGDIASEASMVDWAFGGAAPHVHHDIGGDQFEVTNVSGRIVTISPGQAFLNGYHVRTSAAVNITVPQNYTDATIRLRLTRVSGLVTTPSTDEDLIEVTTGMALDSADDLILYVFTSDGSSIIEMWDARPFSPDGISRSVCADDEATVQPTQLSLIAGLVTPTPQTVVSGNTLYIWKTHIVALADDAGIDMTFQFKGDIALPDHSGWINIYGPSPSATLMQSQLVQDTPFSFTTGIFGGFMTVKMEWPFEADGLVFPYITYSVAVGGTGETEHARIKSGSWSKIEPAGVATDREVV